MPCVGGGNVSAQIRSIYVTVDATDASIREVLESIESQSDLRFVYPDEVKPILTKVVTVSEKNISANRILDQILPGAGLQYSVSGTQVRIYQAASGSRDVAQTVSGTVISGTDNSPLAGVMIYVEGTTAGTITNGDGSYTFTIPAKSKYVTFSYVGFDTKKLHVEDTELFKLVSLAEQSNTLDEVVVIGYGTQKKESMVASITSVKPSDLNITSSSLTTAFAGNIAGMISRQTSGEPGYDSATFYIRGISTFGSSNAPLIILDGAEISMEELYDLYAFRVIVDTIPDCYNVLGHIHDLFNLVPGRFKDYISTPKPNMYQSLHTTVIGSQGIPFEVQIRTWEMHQTAEYGIAAHWKYKQGGAGSGDEKSFEWVRRLLESQQDTDAEDYVHSLKVDMFNDEVFVFTPRGNVINLPAGSTPIDFAYAIHSGVGNSMVGAKINNRIAGFDAVLHNGDIVEILTSKTAKGPSRDWLNICKSNQARSKIKQWYKREKREENIVHGRASFEGEMRRMNFNPADLQDEELLAQVLKKLSFDCLDDLYAAIGYGGLTAAKAVGRIRDDLLKYTRGIQNPTRDGNVNPLRTNPDAPNLNRHSVNGVIVEDIDSCMIKFAKCCTPVPGDPIVGFITKGFGVSIHRADCPNAQNRTDPRQAARWVRVRWAQEENQPFTTTLELDCTTRDGLLLDVATVMTSARVRVKELTGRDLPGGHSTFTVSFEVKDVAELNTIQTKLLNIRDVIGARRGQN